MGRSQSLILVLVLVYGCTYTQEPNVKPIPQDTYTCHDVCNKFTMLKCEQAETLPDGTTCEKFCNDTLEFGHDLDLKCIIERVKTCDEMDKLEEVCR